MRKKVDDAFGQNPSEMETAHPKDRKRGKKNAAKSRAQLWLDLYKKSKLDKEDIE